MNQAAQLSAAQQLASSGAGVPNIESSGAAGGDDDDDDIPELEEVQEEGPVDETGVEPKDIELVMQQVGCSRAKAVRVLKESGGDLINASESAFSGLRAEADEAFAQSWRPASRLWMHRLLYSTLALLCFTSTQNVPSGISHDGLSPSGSEFLSIKMTCEPGEPRLHTQQWTPRLHISRFRTSIPSSQFYVVVGPLPPILDDLQALNGLAFTSIAYFRPTADLKAQLQCSVFYKLPKLPLCEHMVVPVKDLGSFCCLLDALLVDSRLADGLRRENPWYEHVLTLRRRFVNNLTSLVGTRVGGNVPF